jgi:selenocysteine lyase/cysteine desulfurase
LRLKAARTGASVRRVTLYRNARRATEDEIVSSLLRGVGPRTRVVAIMWVHSSTGVKLPPARIGPALGRRRADVLLCVDGVHGLGVEDATVESLGCDFLVAGCHKWLFGPRGTGLVWGRGRAWDSVEATIPSFSGVATPGGEMRPAGSIRSSTGGRSPKPSGCTFGSARRGSRGESTR